jgi:hypothetical protein
VQLCAARRCLCGAAFERDAPLHVPGKTQCHRRKAPGGLSGRECHDAGTMTAQKARRSLKPRAQCNETGASTLSLCRLHWGFKS